MFFKIFSKGMLMMLVKTTWALFGVSWRTLGVIWHDRGLEEPYKRLCKKMIQLRDEILARAGKNMKKRIKEAAGTGIMNKD